MTRKQTQHNFSQAQTLLAAFSTEMEQFSRSVNQSAQSVHQFERSLSSRLKKAFEGLIFKGDTLSEALESVGRGLIRSSYAAAMNPINEHFNKTIKSGVESLFSDLFPHAAGTAQEQLKNFSSGSVQQRASFIAEQNRGIAPSIQRDANAGQMARPVQVTMNIKTPDVEGFERTHKQISQRLSRYLQNSRRFS